MERRGRRLRTAVVRMMARIPIAMPTHNRPGELGRVLAALARCEGIADYVALTSEEPDDGVNALLDAAPERWPTVVMQRHRNERRAGCCANVCAAVDRAAAWAAADGGSGWFIVLEDDVVPADDCLGLLRWCIEGQCDDVEFPFTCGCWRHSSLRPVGNIVTGAAWFEPLGWAMRSTTWHAFRAVFDPAYEPNGPWDWPLNIWRAWRGACMLYPLLARTRHIGAIGTFAQDNVGVQASLDALPWAGDAAWRAQAHGPYSLVGTEGRLPSGPEDLRAAYAERYWRAFTRELWTA